MPYAALNPAPASLPVSPPPAVLLQPDVAPRNGELGGIPPHSRRRFPGVPSRAPTKR